MKQQAMKKQSGFTLIELVIVIIILGILAATAVPKFINLQKDARISALKGVKASMESAATLIYSKAALQGDEKAIKSKKKKVGDILLANGYPVAGSGADIAAAANGILGAVELSDGDWELTATAVDASNKITIKAKNGVNTCSVSYETAAVGKRPKITVVDTDC